jgi:methylmalonyl-CoA mutase C-terminal domain/subunit
VQQALQRLESVARSTENIMPAMLEAVQAYATIGEICDTLTHVFGLYSDPAMSVLSGKQGSGLASAQAPVAGPPRRILVAKPGLDGHDRGAKTMALLLRDAGMEVIYTGIRNSIDAIVHTALQEDVQIIGLSMLSGAHLGWSQQLLERLREQGMEDVKVVVGGVIPEADIPVLKALGVAAVFPGGTPFADVIAAIRTL